MSMRAPTICQKRVAFMSKRSRMICSRVPSKAYGVAAQSRIARSRPVSAIRPCCRDGLKTGVVMGLFKGLVNIAVATAAAAGEAKRASITVDWERVTRMFPELPAGAGVEWTNGGGHLLDVVGESFYTDALEQIVTVRDVDGKGRCTAPAVLVRQPENPYDANAVAVFIDGKQVGHMPATTAAKLAPVIDAFMTRNGRMLGGIATVVGDVGGPIGVRVDVAMPSNASASARTAF